METNVLNEIVGYGVFAVLFFYMLWNYIVDSKDFKKESKEREDKYLNIIKSFEKSLDKFNDSMNSIINKVDTIDDNVKDLDREVKGIKDTLNTK